MVSYWGWRGCVGCLLSRKSPIHRQRRAVGKRGSVGAELEHGAGNFVRFRQTAAGVGVDDPLFQPRLGGKSLFHQRRLHKGRADGIDAAALEGTNGAMSALNDHSQR